MRVNDRFVVPAGSTQQPDIPSVKQFVEQSGNAIEAFRKVRQLLHPKQKQYVFELDLEDGNKLVVKYEIERPYSMRVIDIGREIYERYGVDILSGESLEQQSGYSGDFMIAVTAMLLAFLERFVIEVGSERLEFSAFSSLKDILAFIDEVGLPFAQRLASDISQHLQDIVGENQDFFGA